MRPVSGSTGEENANLYLRGVEEGRRGEVLDPASLLEILDVFGEDGLRSYLLGFAEGEEDALEEPDEDG
jgi:hypothetical protein